MVVSSQNSAGYEHAGLQPEPHKGTPRIGSGTAGNPNLARTKESPGREGRAAGLTPLEAARATDLGEFKDLLDSERIVGNLHRAYLELDGAERGAPVDLAATLGDMVAYNGGQPLSCHA